MFKSYLEIAKKWGRKQSTQSFSEKLKISVIAIVFGILIGFIILAILGYNPMTIFSNLFKGAFKNKAKINTTLIFTAVFTLSGLANAFAFKTNLFNIGVSGQMLGGGAISVMFGLTIFKGFPPVLAIIMMLITAIIIGSLIGLLAGMLKAYLNVHEVVSTILLNWIVFYLIKYIFTPGNSFVSAAGDSHVLKKSLRFGGNTDNAWIAMIILALSAIVIVFVILKFTTFGKKLTITGINKDAAKYSGVNIKFITIISMVISAGIAGMLGFVFYAGHKHFVPRLENTIPTYGFDGIAIALLAFSAPFGIPIISFMYGIFKSGAGLAGINPSISNATIDLIFSVIIFSAACSALFIRFKPIHFTRYIISNYKVDKIKKLINDKNIRIKELRSQLSKHLIKTDATAFDYQNKVLMKEHDMGIKSNIKQIRKTCNYETMKIHIKILEQKRKLSYESSWLFYYDSIKKHFDEKINTTVFSNQRKIDLYKKKNSNDKEKIKSYISKETIKEKEIVKGIHEKFKKAVNKNREYFISKINKVGNKQERVDLITKSLVKGVKNDYI